MIKVRLHTGQVYEALAKQGSAVLIKDAKENKAFFVTKKNICEWHNGNSRMIPEMSSAVFADTSKMDEIPINSLNEHLLNNGTELHIATRIESACINAEVINLGDLFRMGKQSAASIPQMGAMCIDELSKLFRLQYSLEWK